ncbi:hypothetical protein HIM_05951 [Hirsutella minnesotensis 3608]|uniref:DUF7820 domain-containing protein n=1 Tax=Hirsutella minnesotensis 3608 TaxID=1043627 RepID=A0A0F7ZJP7_9HYPO|nr:hypothetical protein HIM_05951 [Hirsutella minnesotensis 3608]
MASSPERRLSRRSAGRSEAAQSDDEYDLSAHVIADGFRPAGPGFIPTTSQYDMLPDPVTRPLSDASLVPPQAISGSDRPSSTSKPPPAHDSLALRHDGSEIVNRRLDGSDSSAFGADSTQMHPESPYRGPAGPSHPYALYPQRTFSMATTSTSHNPNRQSYVGPRGPTHPYALYPQTTTAGTETPQEQIPVGFAGNIGATYQRQIGPDGEEAGGLIGPLGHMEELPPYSRYPEDSPARKTPEVVPTALANSVPVIPGAGGIGIATRNPEFSSTEDDLPALSAARPASRGGMSQHEINTAARDISEKPTMTKWQRRARKKICGIVPCWAIGMLAVGIIIIAVVLSAVTATVLSKNNRKHPHGNGQFDRTPNAMGPDVEPLSAVPGNLAAMATGSFSLPPLDTSQAPKACFADPTQAQSWSCDIPFRFYAMNVDRVPNAPETSGYEMTLSAINATSSKFILGTQPPDVPVPQSLKLVRDVFEEGRGPAWWLKVTYDKTVIVPEDRFQARNTKRDDGDFRGSPGLGMPPPGGPRRKKLAAKEGDKPWICTWPDTTLEIFIYPNQNGSIPSRTASMTMTPTAGAEFATATPEGPPGAKSAYPKVVKFLERRWCNNPKSIARCRQVQIKEGGREKEDLKDGNGNPIEVLIDQNFNDGPGPFSQRQRSQRQYEKRSFHQDEILSRQVLEMTDCGCLWWAT